MKSGKKKQFNKPLFIALAMVVAGVIAGIFLMKQKSRVSNSVQSVTPTQYLTPTRAPTDAAMPGWKEFKNDKIQISYPPDWRINPDEDDATILIAWTSNDYKLNRLSGGIGKGYAVSLLYKRLVWDGTIGLKSTQQVQWLNQPAKLQKYMFDSSNLVLTGTAHGIPIQLVLSAAPNVNVDSYSDLLLQVASTLQIKQNSGLENREQT